MNHRIFIFVIYLLTGLRADAQLPRDSATLKIVHQEKNAVVEGYFYNAAAKSKPLTYQLKLVRKSKTGNQLSNQQSGSFSIAANEKKLLALTTFDVSPLDLYRIYLKVYHKDKLIAEDAIVNWKEADIALHRQQLETTTNVATRLDSTAHRRHTNTTARQRIEQRLEQTRRRQAEIREEIRQRRTTPSPISSKQQSESSPPKPIPTPTPPAIPPAKNTIIPNSYKPLDLEIDGLIIDETRTKIGRDYYELFYAKWAPPAEAKNYTIRIKELPSRGRGAQIQVFVNDEKLIHRNLQPRVEMIENMATRSVEALTNWLLQRNKQQENIKYEGI